MCHPVPSRTGPSRARRTWRRCAAARSPSGHSWVVTDFSPHCGFVRRATCRRLHSTRVTVPPGGRPKDRHLHSGEGLPCSVARRFRDPFGSFLLLEQDDHRALDRRVAHQKGRVQTLLCLPLFDVAVGERSVASARFMDRVPVDRYGCLTAMGFALAHLGRVPSRRRCCGIIKSPRFRAVLTTGKTAGRWLGSSPDVD